MSQRPGPALLWSRALVAGLVFYLVGLLGHLSADGLLPGPGSLLMLGVLSITGAALVLRRPASRARVLALLLVGQAGVHVALSGAAGHGAPAAGEHPHATAPGADLALLASHVGSHLGQHLEMALAHVIATLVIGLWLAYGEKCLWAFLAYTGQQVRALLERPTLPAVLQSPELVRLPESLPALRTSVWESGTGTRRGPPVAA